MEELSRKRPYPEGSFREAVLSCKKKRHALGVLLEELSRPEVDMTWISSHAELVLSQMKQRNATMIPKLVDVIRQYNEPIVLEITQTPKEETVKSAAPAHEHPTHEDELEQEIPGIDVDENAKKFPRPILEESEDSEESDDSGDVLPDGKQFEIIFADSTPPTGNDEHHIIHSTTERSAMSEPAGTVNVPNSFPLFQLVNAGEVPEEMQREIEQKIRLANPQLDLNSITFKFNSPETVEIIANINT